VIDLSALTPKLLALLRASLRDDIEIVTDIAEDVWRVKVDLDELELALLNIAVNARDAMSKGGKLSLRVRNERLAGGAISSTGLNGDFVRIEVTDTGAGIPADVLGKVFEPFFTTKGGRERDGIGPFASPRLCHTGRWRRKHCEHRGEGATVSLLLPRSMAPLLPPELEAASQAPRTMSGVVLLVDDNDDVAEVTMAMLESLGYMVRRARSPQLALEELRRGERVDVVLTDIIMPGGITAIDLARTVRDCYPHLPVLLTTGYSAVAREAIDEGFLLLPKPFQTSALEKVIRGAVDREVAPSLSRVRKSRVWTAK
jgi:two-component system NtrC family sensor kinase